MKYLTMTTALLLFALATFSQELPWRDNFDDGDMNGWTIVDDAPYSAGPSDWRVSLGELLQLSNIFTNENEYDVFKGTHVFAGDKDWRDYYFLARIYSSDNDGIGMLFRYQDENNYYRFITVQDPGNRGPFKRLEKQVNGQFITLAEDTSNIKIPGRFIGKVHVVGDSIYFYENNELLFAVQDDEFDSGKIGLMCYANDGAVFDDIYVSERDTVYEEQKEPGKEILVANRRLQVKAMTLNIWVHGRITTPAQVAELIQSLDVDVAGLQECNNEFGGQVAALTGMYLAASADCFLLSKTPYIRVERLPVKGVNAWTNIDSQTVSLYNFHIPWDEAGDRAARRMVDDIFTHDPVPLQLAMGDFNDEHYSTQITIIEEHMRYCLADLGWAPSQRVTWPAFGFYGGEGAQTIDLLFCNKASKGRAIDGEILNTSPVISDHKPVWATIEFPADKQEIGPRLTRVIPCFGDEMIELWFDQDLDAQSAGNPDNYSITPMNGGAAVNVLQAERLKDPRRVRLLTSPHEYDKTYRISVSNVADEFGSPTIGVPLEYIVRANLLTNSGAEDGVSGWQTTGGFTAVPERENQTPYTGELFFTGENLQQFSAGKQVIDLSKFADDIDAGRLAAEWNCYFATGYEVLGDIKASRCEPYDEGEMIVEFLDADGVSLLQASSKRWDTLYWHPYGETTYIPPGTRQAVVYLNSYRKTANGVSNDAAFDNAFFTVKKLDYQHGYGRNLLVNPSAETGDLQGWNVWGAMRARAHEENKARPLSGYYLISNAGAAKGEASQTFDVSQNAAKIDAGEMAVRWGGYMRDYRGDSGGEILVEFYDDDKEIIATATTGEQRIAEWQFYDTETAVPPGTRVIAFFIRMKPIAEEGVYFDFLHLIPIDRTLSRVTQNSSPVDFALRQNYPNPFNAATIIAYELSQPGRVELRIYNTLGQEIALLVDGYQDAGSHKVTWSGAEVPSGLYFYELRTSQVKSRRKMMLLK